MQHVKLQSALVKLFLCVNLDRQNQRIILSTKDTARSSVSALSVSDGVDTCLRYHWLHAPAWDFDSRWWYKDAGSFGVLTWFGSGVPSPDYPVVWPGSFLCCLLTHLLWFLYTCPDNSPVHPSIPWTPIYSSSKFILFTLPKANFCYLQLRMLIDSICTK